MRLIQGSLVREVAKMIAECIQEGRKPSETELAQWLTMLQSAIEMRV